MSEAELAALAWRERFRRHDGARRYVEAYPRLDIGQCVRAARKGLSACIWREAYGEAAGGRMVGAAEFDWRSETDLRLSYRFGRDWDRTQAEQIALVVERSDARDFNHRPLARCPLCGQGRSALVFYRHCWGCRRCHGLGYRSTMIGTPVRRAEKVRRLRRELGDLERRFYPERRLAAKRAQLERAVAALRGSEAATAHAGLALVIVATWGMLQSRLSVLGTPDVEGSAF